MDVEGEAFFLGFGEGAFEHVAGVAEAGLAFGGEHVAEHAGGSLGAATPWEYLEGGGVGFDDHVVFGDSGEAFDGRSVEAEAFFEGGFEFGGCDGHGFEGAENVGEP